MQEVLVALQMGIVLTTPVFFVVVLVVLWRLVRTTESMMAVVVHIKRQIEIVGRGGHPGGARPTDQVRKAEARMRPKEPGGDADPQR